MTNQPFDAEIQMYPAVCGWLTDYLRGRFKGANVEAHDTHAIDLNAYIRRHRLDHFFPDQSWATYEIRVDVTGFLEHRGRTSIVLVECKLGAISLMNLAQLLGYCRIAQPIFGLLVSPMGAGSALRSLIRTYSRSDVLEFAWPKRELARQVIVAKWDMAASAPDPSTLLPPGSTL